MRRKNKPGRKSAATKGKKRNKPHRADPVDQIPGESITIHKTVYIYGNHVLAPAGGGGCFGCALGVERFMRGKPPRRVRGGARGTRALPVLRTLGCGAGVGARGRRPWLHAVSPACELIEDAILDFGFEISPRFLQTAAPTFQISDFKFQISNFKFQISDFRFQISDFRLPLSACSPSTKSPMNCGPP
jgi:hypothetical protein